MAPRIIEIVIYLVREMRAGVRIFDRMSEISPLLRNQGYTENEIESAFSWVLEQGATRRNDRRTNKSGGSMRVLSEAEAMAFTHSGYANLVQMRELGIINEEQMELIIHRALTMHGEPWDHEMVKTMASLLLFEDKMDISGDMIPIISSQISSDTLH